MPLIWSSSDVTIHMEKRFDVAHSFGVKGVIFSSKCGSSYKVMPRLKEALDITER